MSSRRRPSVAGVLVTAGLALAMLLPLASRDHAASWPEKAGRGGDARLVDYQSYADLSGGVCVMPALEQQEAFAQSPQAGAGAAAGALLAAPGAGNPFSTPVRTIRDSYPSFAAIGVDPTSDEVIVTDENLFQILVYDRREHASPQQAVASRPKRAIGGDNTNIEFQSGLYIDPKNGDIYAPNNDTVNLLVVFSRGASGDVKPVRALRTPHGTFGITVDERREEMFLTTQHDSSVVVFRKGASGDDAPIRLLQGTRTGLADPHGIAFDPKNDVFFVANYGSRHENDRTRRIREGTGLPNRGIVRDNWPVSWEQAVPGTGSMKPPSITVYARDAAGNTPPLRVITGPKTQLNWPTGLSFDPERQELFVANDMGPSILVFDATASGDVAPKRVLKGPRTGLANPTDVKLDPPNGELWVANFGGHTATAYPITAQGDTPPLRTIRSGPPGAPSLMIGNPGAVAYDSNRQELLVPN